MRKLRWFWLALLLLGACGPVREGTVVLRFATWGGASEETEYTRTLQRLFREFERENPGVKIREEKIPDSKDYVAKMLLSFVAGTEPEVMMLDASSAAVFIDNGALMNLRPLIDADREFREADYFPNVWKIATRGEAVYGLPGDFTPMVVYYNRRLFREAGVPEPRPGWSIADFRRTAQRLTRNGRWGFKLDNWMPGWIPWVWNLDGDVLSTGGKRAAGALDADETVRAVEFLRDLVNRDKVAPALSQVAASGVDPFLNGDAAMQVSGHWALVGIKDAPKLRMEDIGVVAMPSDLPTTRTVMYASGPAIGRNCRHPKEAWAFVKFLTSKRYQLAYQSSGVAISGRRDVAEHYAAGDPRRQTFLQIVPSARMPWGASVEGYDFVETLGPKVLDAVLAGADARTELRRAARRIDEYFEIR